MITFNFNNTHNISNSISSGSKATTQKYGLRFSRFGQFLGDYLAKKLSGTSIRRYYNSNPFFHKLLASIFNIISAMDIKVRYALATFNHLF
jgi:hypothetical protein